LNLKPDEEFNLLQKNFKKALSRGLKKDLKNSFNQLAESLERLNFESWVIGTKHSTNRLGLLVCQEPKEALMAITQLKEENGSKNLLVASTQNGNWRERADWLQKNPQARTLLQFALSEDYLLLRKRLGLSLPAY